MKILFFDALFPRGHKTINNAYLGSMLKMKAEVYVCAEDGWFDMIDNCHLVKKPWIRPSENTKSKWVYRKNIIVNFKLLKNAIQEINPDIIYIASYDILSFIFSFPGLIKYRNKIFLQEHNNVDQLQNRVKKLVYDLFKNIFHHFVFEEYIKNRLIELGVKENLISIVPHPVPPASFDAVLAQERTTAIGLSNSNDEEIIEAFLAEQKKSHFLDSSNTVVILKSKRINYSDDHLKIFSGWINDAEYTKWCRACSSFIIPFSKNGYSYRVSCVFMEAISNNKTIIASRFPLVEYYSEKYPGVCKIFDNVYEIASLLKNCDNDKYQSARKQFILEHSDSSIVNAFRKAFAKMM